MESELSGTIKKITLKENMDIGQEAQELFCLKLNLNIYSMNERAHAAWLLNHIDSNKNKVGIITDSSITKLNQFSQLSDPTIFVCFDDDAHTVLSKIAGAKNKFNPNEFDQDGYRNV